MCPGSNRKLGHFAYFPGTGPAGTTCRMCRHFRTIHDARGRGKCARAARLLGRPWDSLSEILGGAPSCKYFDGRRSS